MQVLKIATAATIIVGPVLDSGGLAVTNAVIGDFRLTAGGTTSTLASPATATHSHNGHYTVALSTANTSAIGLLTISSGNSNHAMPPSRFQVVNAATYDSYFSQFVNFAATIASEIAGSIETDDNNWDVATAIIAGRAADAVWSEAIAGQNFNGTFGWLAQSVKAKTDQLTFTVAGQVDANALTGGGLTQADVRTAIGLASANLDAQLAGISMPSAINSSQISAVVSTRRIRLAAGSADNDAYNGCLVVIRDQSTAVRKDVNEVEDYDGLTREIVLKTDPVFTPDTNDYVDIIADRSSTVFVSIPQQAVPIPDSAGTRLYAFVGEDKIHLLTGLDSDYRAVLLELKIKDRFGVTILTLSDASLTKTATTISFTIPKSYLTQRAEWNWSIRLADGTGLVQLWGPYIVLYAA